MMNLTFEEKKIILQSLYLKLGYHAQMEGPSHIKLAKICENLIAQIGSDLRVHVENPDLYEDSVET